MSYFFRYEPDGFITMNMLLIRITFVVMLCLAYKLRKKKNVLLMTITGSVIMQILMFAWYAGDKTLFLKEGLPLYHCRIAAVMTAVGYTLKQKSMTRYFAWLGMIGAIIAFSFPDPAPFVWPHLTNVTYICMHIFIGMSSLIIISEGCGNLKASVIGIYTLSMNIVLVIVNRAFNSNYGYLMNLPKLFSFNFNPIQLFIIMFTLIAGGIYGCDRLYDIIYKQMKLSRQRRLVLK
ncbi:MAG: YwaF family protein [Hornefia sp.]|nr:YwaF family protein [Hornefia sp.]